MCHCIVINYECCIKGIELVILYCIADNMTPTTYFVAVDGVSNSLRTKFLKKLENKSKNVKVHTMQGFDLGVDFDSFTNDAAMVYARRLKYEERFVNNFETVHVFNQMPASLLIAQLLHKRHTSDEFDADASKLVESINFGKLCEGYKCYVLLDKNRSSKKGYAKKENDIYELLALKCKFTVLEIDEDDDDHDKQAQQFATRFYEDQFKWTRVDSCHVYSRHFPRTTHLIAGFDLDDTLIVTKSRQTFPQDEFDWQFKYEKKIIYYKMRKLLEAGYTVVVFTNQNGIQYGHVKLETMVNKIRYITDELNLPITVVMSTLRDFYRKPHTGMLDRIVANEIPSYVPRYRWIYVGDNVKGTSFDDSDFAQAAKMTYFDDSNFFNLNVMF
ncbi:ORF120 [Leucania separata nucleopolyhedrovirus]|uniref:ORF120 n=1 Tax=Leucania separata nucleopolyhedrovirus TaxID=1307956 RepID=Q0IKZ9_NPVLS|nr:ORF120 [Leucania separata nucleopolyhedrovirus]AAR28884.1 ORF120 [Leucania separata nucleopolyhedrovirus]